MTRLSGRVPETGTAIQGATVAIIDTQGVEDPSQWSVVAFDTTDANGEWSVSGLDASAVERYHAVAQYEDGSSFTNFESLPYLSTPADVFAPETALAVGTPTPTVEVASAIPDSGVSYWKFDDTSDTTTAVDSWSGFDGVINGATYTSTSHEGDALDFSSSSDFVTVGTNSSLEEGDTFSISTYIRTTDSNIDNRSRTVVKQEGSGNFDGWWLSFNRDGSGSARFVVLSGSYDKRIDGSTAVNDGQYHHIVGTYDSNSSQRLYVDGSLEASVTGGPSPSTGHKADMLFGRREDGTNSSFTGQMDEIKFYNKTLTDTEVSNLYNTGSI